LKLISRADGEDEEYDVDNDAYLRPAFALGAKAEAE